MILTQWKAPGALVKDALNDDALLEVTGVPAWENFSPKFDAAQDASAQRH